MRKDSLYARRDYNLDSGVGPSAFDATDGHLHTPSRLGGTGPELAMAATAAATPELIVERDGWGYLVYIRHDLSRYGLDGYGRRVYGHRRAQRYGKRLLAHYLKLQAR